MKIALTSCYRTRKAKVWDSIKSTKPDVLLFLGDFVYLDDVAGRYHKNLDDQSKREIFRRIKESFDDHLDYPPFKSLRERSIFLATWDDHDFQKNGAVGTDKTLDEIYIDKMTSLFLQATYKDPRGTVHRYKDFRTDYGKIRIVMLDVRTYRNPELGGRKDKAPTILGSKQMDWLEDSMKVDYPVLICSGSTINSPPRIRKPFSKNLCKRESRWLEHWASYQKLIELASEHGRCLVLSGDIHKNEFVRHQHNALKPFYEVTASGANAGWGQNGKYAIIGIQSNEIRVSFYKYKKKQGDFSIDLLSWELKHYETAAKASLYREGGDRRFFECAAPG